MAEKVPTIMVLTVDLQCHRCFKKVKKVLCKFPQIQDQEYNEKQNTVTIKVICCCPEKIKQKILCKGGGCITSIEIRPPPSKKPPNPPKKPDPPKTPEKSEKPPPEQVPNRPPVPPPPVPCFPPVSPICVCFRLCYVCPPGGPCCHGRPPPCSGSCRRPVYDSYGCGCGCGGYRPCYWSRCDYFCQENTSECSIM